MTRVSSAFAKRNQLAAYCVDAAAAPMDNRFMFALHPTDRGHLMLRHILNGLFMVLALGAALPAAAQATDPYGVWKRPSDGTTFNFSKCGEGLCVKVRGVTDPADKKLIGATVFSGATKTGPNSWQGKVVNLEDGQTYMGKITITGPTSVKLEGCVMGGAICDGEDWVRGK